MAKLAFGVEAVADLEDIYAFSIAEFGQSVADDYYYGLQAACERLIEHPEQGPVFRGLCPQIRFLTYRRHHIYYRYDGETVLIIRLLHHAMEARRRLRRARFD